MSKQKKTSANMITQNRKALHDYHVERRFEAGLVLEGWEVKSLRANRAQLKESYVVLRHGEAWLIGAHITPLPTASTHITPDPIRTRKLLLHQRELSQLHQAIQQQGYTAVALDLHWRHQHAKATIALAKGKKQFDKRETAKKLEWQREQQRTLNRKG